MLEKLKTLDTQLLLYLNSHHSPFLDQIMWLFTNTYFWLPLYGLFLFLLYKNYTRAVFLVLIICIALMIALNERLNHLSKETIMRFRPTHEPSIESLIHTVKGYRGGMYGFYSAHAANSFSVAIFIIALLVKRHTYIIWLALGYAILTSYSRIYLGVHYPGDIITGACVGICFGLLFSEIFKKVHFEIQKQQYKISSRKCDR